MQDSKTPQGNKPVYTLILVAALGYFVDIYDLILFNVVKKASLEAIGIHAADLEEKGIFLFNMQMMGMLIGGILWGVLGDKKGRLSVLFGSIITYSLANILNGFVTDLNSYALLRFVAGIGLAGELGAGITLVSETMSKETRGIGTMIIVTFGALGAVLAALIGDMLSWQMSYWMGGAMGLALLALRLGTYESGMFLKTKDAAINRGLFLSLFTNKERRTKYLDCIAVGLPIWFAIGVLIALLPQFKPFLKLEEDFTVGTAIMYTYLGLSAGDLISGILSQLLKSRKKVVIGYLVASLLLMLVFLFTSGHSSWMFKIICFLIGGATGYWALFVTIASEQFGTNLRSTVTTTVPNFVRGAVVPITLSFSALSGYLGVIVSAFIVGMVCLFLAFRAIYRLKETFHEDLDYFETL